MNIIGNAISNASLEYVCNYKCICFSAELLLSGALACHSIDYSEPFLILIIPFLCARYTTP